MPNYVTNQITIDSQNVDEIIEFVQNEQGEFDFNKIIPMPECLVESVSGFFGDSERQSELERQNAANIAECGYANWYDWRCQHWDTKWNANETFFNDNQIEFETAWSTPVSIMVELSDKFPEAEFIIKYADEDIGSNCGEYHVKAGEIIHESIAPRYSEQTTDQRAYWANYAMDVKGYDEQIKTSFF